MKFHFDESEANVALTGELTFADYVAFRDIADRLLKVSARPIVIDLSQLEFIDSAGLGMLLIARDEALKSNQKVILRSPRGQVRRLFAATRLDALFTVEDA
jgi:anti-anti-sigma factor